MCFYVLLRVLGGCISMIMDGCIRVIIDNCKPILLFSCVPCFFAGLFLGIEVAPLLGLGGFLAFWMTGILIGCLLSGLAAVGEHLIEKYGYQDYITLKDSETFIPKDQLDCVLSI